MNADANERQLIDTLTAYRIALPPATRHEHTKDELEVRQVLNTYLPPNWDNNTRKNKLNASETASHFHYRRKIQRAFYQNALLDAPSLGRPAAADYLHYKRALARGRYERRLLYELLRIKKYRSLHKRYGWAAQHSPAELAAYLVPGEGPQTNMLPATDAVEALVRNEQVGLGNRSSYGFMPSDD
ncbi:hypothetical protein STCU_11531 [Strigomonas culicis]|uniref:Uncharacterized protein n=1 Tax=Strigomonas culicis TaxID=28005 RepID=S9TDQ5_9TRYP|nr:hypothetical protein STCU_11531 [Strigomonas culicis]|eukprot:EPY16137.1 hypothetical protein STCU_11531 [Strigomonas culicis]